MRLQGRSAAFMVNDSVEIAEDVAEDERDRVRIRYYNYS